MASVSQVSVVVTPENQEKLMQIQPNIAQINLRTMTGTCHTLNKHAIDWSSNGLIAYGSHGVVVIVDPRSLKAIQTLDGEHRASVTKLRWSRAPNKKHVVSEMMLASADAAGRISIWNVKSGEVKTRLQEGSKPPAEMVWMDDRIEGTGHLLLVLHPPNILVLWDTVTGKQVWKKTYASETLLGFDLDPFVVNRLAFRTVDCILFINDFSRSKCPSQAGKKLYVSGPIRQSPSRNSDLLTPESVGNNARVRIKKMMKEFVLGEGTASSEQAMAAIMECQQILFHQCARNHMILVYPREVLVLDLDIGQTVGMVALDRSSSPIVHLSQCSLRDVFYILLDNGVVSMRVRNSLYTVACTPYLMSRSSSVNSVGNTPSVNNDSSSDIFNQLTEIHYDQRSISDPVRLAKNAKILKFAVDPVTQNRLVIFSSDGKLFFLDLKLANNNNAVSKANKRRPLFTVEDMIPSTIDMNREWNAKLQTSGILSGMNNPPSILKMCPALTTKNWPVYQPLMASGFTNGNVQIICMATGLVEREFAVHTFPVRGIEWSSLHSILSHAHQNLSGSAHHLVRNELNHTDVRTGKSTPLRSHRSEEPPIDMIKVSQLKQFFIVAFKNAPFELWDLKNLNLLRTMPKKFPPITALEWSPLHNLKSLKKKQEAEIKEKSKSPEPNEESEKPLPLVAKEHFVFTDTEGQLYHFSVEGNAIRDGTKVPAEASLSTITCISWKSDHIVRGDSEGNLNVWDVRTKTSRNVSTRRGMIKKIRFAPGRGNMKLLVLHMDAVAIWDVKECEIINELRAPKDLVYKPIDIEWAASDRPVIATADGCLRIMSLALTLITGPMEPVDPVSCLGLLPNKAKNHLKLLLHHQPWNDGGRYSLDLDDRDGLGQSEFESVREQIGLFPKEVRNYLGNNKITTLDRCKMAAQVCGLGFEADFWTVASSVLTPTGSTQLDTRFDLIADSPSYLRYQLERLHMHENKVANEDQRRRVIDQMLCLGLKDEAVAVLLESESETNPHHYEDSLRACLVASCATSGQNNNTTIKLVATNLIADGKLWEGVELLCLIDKVQDACTYLQSCNNWDESLWLGKCRLASSQQHGEEMSKVLTKYCEHAASNGEHKKAILLKLGVRDFVAVLDQLMVAKMIPLAAQFLQVLQDNQAMPDTSHAMVLTEEISLAYARRLFDCGNVKGAFFYCDKADEKGGMLRKELEALNETKVVSNSSDHESNKSDVGATEE